VTENRLFKTESHTDRSFDEQLQAVNSQIILMGEQVVKLLEIARKSLEKPSKKLVEESKSEDRKLNALDFDVQQKATKIIALRQPLGVDLRFIIAVLKISSSLERMGDLAKSSCKKASRFHNLISEEINSDLHEINALATKMVNDTMNAYRDMDAAKANYVLGQDDEVDDLYHKLLDDVKEHARINPDLIPAFGDIIFAAKNMERIGDHCTKLADLVHYIASGEHVGKVANQKKQFEDKE